jgi:hypothetical protein
MPEDLDLKYKFSTQVMDTKADGIVVLRYLRPTVTEIQGETWNSAPKTTVDKINFNYLLTVSPINEIIEMNDQSKKKGMFTGLSAGADARQLPLGQFIQEVYRLALCTGSFDSSLDFAPKLPFDKVKVGDTWQRTVSYQPQKLKGENKSAVQRLDYTYTYNGQVTVGGKKFDRVNATLALNTDLAAFLNEALGAEPEETGLKAMPLNLNASIDFDLDLATRRTINAVATSTGGFKLFLTGDPENPEEEQRLKGHTVMHLVPDSGSETKKKGVR